MEINLLIAVALVALINLGIYLIVESKKKRHK